MNMNEKITKILDNTTGILLVGGQGRRMGHVKKSELKFNDKTFYDISLEALSVCKNTIVSVNSKERFSNLKEPLVEDLQQIGPIGGIYSSFLACKTDYAFVLSCDLPLIKQDFIEFMASNYSEEYIAVIPVLDGNKNALCALYNTSILPYIEEDIKNQKLAIIKTLLNLNVKYVDISNTQYRKMLLNVNTPDDYSKL